MAGVIDSAALWWVLYAVAAMVLAFRGASRRSWMLVLGLIVAGLVRFGDGSRASEMLALALWAVPAPQYGYHQHAY